MEMSTGVSLLRTAQSLLTGRTLNVRIFSFDGKKSSLLKKCFSDLNLYEAIKSSGSVVQLKLKCLADENISC